MTTLEIGSFLAMTDLSVWAEVRDFLMRAALYQSTQFSRDDLRDEARDILFRLEGWLRTQQAAQPPPEEIEVNGSGLPKRGKPRMDAEALKREQLRVKYPQLPHGGG